MDKFEKKPKQPQWSPTQLNIGYFLVAMLAVLLFQAWWSYREVEQIPYSQFEQLLDDGRIAQVEVSDNTISGRYVEPRNGRSYFITNRVEPELSQRLEDAGVEFTGAMDTGWFTTLLSWIIPVLLILAVWLFIFRQVAEKQGFGGLMNVGKSKAKVYVEKDTGVTFDDVAGSTRPRSSCRKSSRSSATRKNTAGWARAFRKASCWWARRAPARR